MRVPTITHGSSVLTVTVMIRRRAMGINTLSNAAIAYSAGDHQGNIISNDSSNTPSGKITESLVKYIPTEMLTPYLIAVSSAPALNWNTNTIFATAIILTPIVFLIIHLSKGIQSNKSVREIGWRTVPWQMIAATISFAIWAYAIPTSDQGLMSVTATDATRVVLQGVLASVISPILTIFEPIAVLISNFVADRLRIP